jgi:hypothetical protein
VHSYIHKEREREREKKKKKKKKISSSRSTWGGKDMKKGRKGDERDR